MTRERRSFKPTDKCRQQKWNNEIQASNLIKKETGAKMQYI